MFPSVLALIEDNIAKDGSTSRRGISAKEQLMVTLRYLAEGESHKTSGVTTAPATPAMQGGGTLGGRHITKLTVF